MNLNVYYNKAADITALKIARREAEAALSAVDQLELAVEFGRCLKCKAALDTMTTILCDDCNDTVMLHNGITPEMIRQNQEMWDRAGVPADRIDAAASFDKIVIPGTSGPGPHITGESCMPSE